MRIRSQDVILGLPALRLRALLRRWGPTASSVALIADELGVAEKKARILMTALEREGLVARYDMGLRERVDGSSLPSRDGR